MRRFKLVRPTRHQLFVISIIFLSLFYGGKILAEQVGSSPESGSSSRLKTASDYLVTLSYGSTSAGSWGDWGLMWNRIYSAARAPFNDAVAKTLKNGSGTGVANCAAPPSGAHANINCYTQALGGVDDYNNGQTIPANTYQGGWTACNVGNNYCSTGDSTNADHQDVNTGLVWSKQISSSATWFVANNCVAPGGTGSLGATCVNDGDPGCICVKNTSVKTGCENLTGWRLPYQKELMQSYIDGSWNSSNLSSAGNYYWSATTYSIGTQNAWGTNQYIGYSNYNAKTSSYAVRCVR